MKYREFLLIYSEWGEENNLPDADFVAHKLAHLMTWANFYLTVVEY